MVIVMVFLTFLFELRFKRYERPEHDRSELLDFEKKRDLTYAAIALHSHHVYNSDGIFRLLLEKLF